MRHLALLSVILFAASLAACSEKPQTVSKRKVDGKPWQGAQNGFVAPGWKPGDEASWDEQMRNRAQGQSEYSRATVAAR